VAAAEGTDGSANVASAAFAAFPEADFPEEAFPVGVAGVFLDIGHHSKRSRAFRFPTSHGRPVVHQTITGDLMTDQRTEPLLYRSPEKLAIKPSPEVPAPHSGGNLRDRVDRADRMSGVGCSFIPHPSLTQP
jgi:hypothetical protein